MIVTSDGKNGFQDVEVLPEIIAAIWASDASVQPSNCYLQGERGGYRYRMAGYDYRQGFCILPGFSEAA
jgi:hypothetical protein